MPDNDQDLMAYPVRFSSEAHFDLYVIASSADDAISLARALAKGDLEGDVREKIEFSLQTSGVAVGTSPYAPMSIDEAQRNLALDELANPERFLEVSDSLAELDAATICRLLSVDSDDVEGFTYELATSMGFSGLEDAGFMTKEDVILEVQRQASKGFVDIQLVETMNTISYMTSESVVVHYDKETGDYRAIANAEDVADLLQDQLHARPRDLGSLAQSAREAASRSVNDQGHKWPGIRHA